MFRTCWPTSQEKCDYGQSREKTDLGDTSLHNEEVRVVDVELYTLEERLNTRLLAFVAIEKILVDIWKGDLYKYVSYSGRHVDREPLIGERDDAKGSRVATLE